MSMRQIIIDNDFAATLSVGDAIKVSFKAKGTAYHPSNSFETYRIEAMYPKPGVYDRVIVDLSPVLKKTKSQKFSTTSQRLLWLRERRGLCVVASFHQIFRWMQKDGLYSKMTNAMDCHIKLKKLIEIVRSEP